VGKSTLALDVALPDGGYLDLGSPEDRSKLSNVEQYLRARLDRLIVLDEVQRMPSPTTKTLLIASYIHK